MKKLKVAMLMDSWYPDINGVILVMENLIKCMKDYADVTLIVPKMGEDDDKDYPFKIIRIDSVPLFVQKYRFSLVDIEYIKLKKLFKKMDFDIVHIHSPFAMGRLGLRIAKEKKIPAVITMHVRWEFEFEKYLKSKHVANMCVKHLIKTYKKCDSAIALNDALIKVYNDYGYNGKVEVINNGTDLKIVKNEEKTIDRINNLFNIKDNEKVLLFVGRIISIKNVFFILDVVKKLKDKGFKYKMIYVGDGPDYDNLNIKVKEYDLSNEVVLAGRIMDRELLKSIYYRADLFLFPSLFDSSSLVQIEAASQETPTLFVKNAITADTIIDNVNGFTEELDVDKYTNKILSIFEDKKLYDKVSKNARKDLAKPWDTIAQETYNYYLKVIDEYNDVKKV